MVVFVTRDTNMRIKADALGITAEDYEHAHIDVDGAGVGHEIQLLPARDDADIERLVHPTSLWVVNTMCGRLQSNHGVRQRSKLGWVHPSLASPKICPEPRATVFSLLKESFFHVLVFIEKIHAVDVGVVFSDPQAFLVCDFGTSNIVPFVLWEIAIERESHQQSIDFIRVEIRPRHA